MLCVRGFTNHIAVDFLSALELIHLKKIPLFKFIRLTSALARHRSAPPRLLRKGEGPAELAGLAERPDQGGLRHDDDDISACLLKFLIISHEL
jgi:hypothetical protein